MIKSARQDPLVFEFFNEIGIIEQLSRARLDRVLPHGLTSAQFRVLNHFARLGGEQTPVELARAFQVTKGAMTNAVQKLEAKGFVATAPDPHDGRAKRVCLTQDGKAARDDAIEAIAPFFSLLLATFDDGEFEVALPFLRRVRVFLDEHRDALARQP